MLSCRKHNFTELKQHFVSLEFFPAQIYNTIPEIQIELPTTIGPEVSRVPTRILSADLVSRILIDQRSSGPNPTHSCLIFCTKKIYKRFLRFGTIISGIEKSPTPTHYITMHIGRGLVTNNFCPLRVTVIQRHGDRSNVSMIYYTTKEGAKQAQFAVVREFSRKKKVWFLFDCGLGSR